MKALLAAMPVLLALAAVPAFAQGDETTTVPLSQSLALEMTTLSFAAPSDNALPWGYVEGKIASHAPGYPVIIKMFDAAGDPVHFAQTGVAADGSYEYKFRVLDSGDGQIKRAFEGGYTVVVFKVVSLPGVSIA